MATVEVIDVLLTLKVKNFVPETTSTVVGDMMMGAASIAGPVQSHAVTVASPIRSNATRLWGVPAISCVVI